MISKTDVTMNIIGIDCATQDKKVGVACGRLEAGRVEVLTVYVGDRAGSVLEHLMKSCVRGEPTLLALDAPLGWPAALGPALAGHTAGGYISIDANYLFRRRRMRALKRNWANSLSMWVRIESQGRRTVL